MNECRINPMILSYKTLRRLVGILALSISIICILGGLFFGNKNVENSISAYYYTNMGDFLEAVLMGIGAFIIFYYGYSTLDRIINTLAGFFCICISLFPASNGITMTVGIFQINSNISNIIHLIVSAIFFALLGFISMFLFTKTNKQIVKVIGKNDTMTNQKKIRNIIYIVCGAIIAICGITIGLLFAFVGETIMNKYYMVLILEIIILTAFGISWLIKGETLFRDKSTYGGSILFEKLYKKTKKTIKFLKENKEKK